LGAEVVLIHLLDRGAVGVAGVVDDHVECPERVDGRLYRGLRGHGIGDIERGRPTTIAEPGEQIGQLLRAPGGRQHSVAALQNCSRELEPEPPRAPRDQPCSAHQTSPI
jgi:hypothetical protein